MTVTMRIMMTLYLCRRKLHEKNMFKTRQDWLQSVKRNLLQSEEARREEEKRERGREVLRQLDLERLEGLERMEVEKEEVEGEEEEEREESLPEKSKAARRQAKLVALAEKKEELEAHKLFLFSLLQDRRKLRRLQG